VFTYFNAFVSIFRDWFRRIWMRQRGWRVGFPQVSGTTQITLSSVSVIR